MVRDYLTLREIQLAELDMLIAFDAFCRQNDLHYTLFGGTMLGALRHGGFIPWDDDIDTAVPRPDYDRLLELVYDEHQEIGRNIRLLSGDRDEGFAFPFAKLVRTDIALDPSSRAYSHDGDGVWIDLFPLDGLPGDPEEMKQKWAEAASMRRHLARSISIISRKRQGEGTLKWLARAPLSLLARIKGYAYYRDRMIASARSTGFEDSCIVGNIVYGVDNPELEILDQSEIQNLQDIGFEGHSFMCINDPDAFLTRRYGDWKALPPEEERNAHFMKAYRIQK